MPVARRGRAVCFIIPSPKQRDLLRDGVFALHSFPCDDNEDAFYLTGRAYAVRDGALRHLLVRQFVSERSRFGVEPPADDHVLFRFDVDSCLLTRTTTHGEAAPTHLVWRG